MVNTTALSSPFQRLGIAMPRPQVLHNCFQPMASNSELGPWPFLDIRDSVSLLSIYRLKSQHDAT